MISPFLVFDLDGTLIDGYAAIEDALAWATERLGCPVPTSDQVRRMVGHGLERLLEQVVGEDRAAEGVRLYRGRYPAVAVEKSRLLPGVPEVLAALEARGYAMALASNKPANYSSMILEAKGVARFFRAIRGPDERKPAKPDPTMLFDLMNEVGALPAETLVVGDMEIDAEFARAAGCRVVLVHGGSRAREELERVECDGFLDAIGQLPGWLLS